MAKKYRIETNRGETCDGVYCHVKEFDLVGECIGHFFIDRELKTEDMKVVKGTKIYGYLCFDHDEDKSYIAIIGAIAKTKKGKFIFLLPHNSQENMHSLSLPVIHQINRCMCDLYLNAPVLEYYYPEDVFVE